MGRPARLQFQGDIAPDLPLHHVLWQRASSQGAPVVRAILRDGLILVATEKGWIHAYDMDGTQQWSEDLGQVPQFPPTLNSHEVAFVVDNDLVVLSRATGARKVRKRLSFTPSAPPVAGEMAVYIPAWDGSRIYALDVHSGDEGWRLRTGGPVSGAPAVVGNAPRQLLVVATENGGVLGLDALPADAVPDKMLWESETQGRNTASLFAATADTVLLASEDMFVYALDPVTGERRWSYGAAEPLVRTPVSSGDAVFVAAPSGLLALSLLDGHLLWKHGNADRLLVRDGGRAVLLDEETSNLLTVDMATGAVLEEHDGSAFAFFLTNTGGNGRLVLVGKTGEMLALDGRLPTP
jgi:outer membrane protein assembly factor BamB